MTLRQIDAFRAIMITGTVTQAAEMLHISQPAVSRLVADLEIEIGFKLFARTGRQLVPSEEAKALYHEIQRAFVGLNQIMDTAEAIRNYQIGQLRLIAIPSVGSYMMPEVIARYSERYPGVSVSLEIQPTQQAFEWIISQQCDLGITAFPVENTAVNVRPLMLRDSVCVLPTNHRLVKEPFITPKLLEGESFISFRPDSLYRFRIDEIFQRLNIKRLPRFEARSIEAICGMVAAGLGVSVIGPFIPRFEQIERIVVRPFRPTLRMELALLWPSHRPLTRVAERFIETLDKYVVDQAFKRSPSRLSPVGAPPNAN